MAIPSLPTQGSTTWYSYAQGLDTAARGAAVTADIGVAGTPTGDALKAAFAPSLPQFHGVRYVAYGHSFGQVQGSGATANAWAGGLYPARLRDLLHTDASLYANQTQSGTTMDQIASHAAATWTVGNYGLVSLLGNQNSAGQGQSQATFQGAVRQFLNALLTGTNSPPTILVYKDTTCTAVGYARYSGGTYNDATVATYNGWLTSVLAEYPTAPIVVADPLADGWNPAVHTCTDGQHPNDRGMALLAASGLRALAAAPYRDGLNLGFPLPPVSDTSPALSTMRGTVTYGTGKFGAALTGGVLALASGLTAPVGTIEAWIKTTTTRGPVVAIGASTGNAMWLGTQGGAGVGQVCAGLPGSSISGGPALNNGAWHHIAVTYDGANATIWADGQNVGVTGYAGGLDLSGNPAIGGYGANSGYDWCADGGGAMDEVRISKSVRYTANFTPATGPFSLDANTLALYHLES